MVTVAAIQAEASQPATNTTQIAPLKVGGDVTPPRPIYAPDGEYSEEARKAKHNGTCVLQFTVGADGKTSNITVLHPAGMGLDEKAIEAVRTWTFEPARKEGNPVPVQIQVSMSFNIGNLGRFKLKQSSKVRAAFKKRMQALIYRIPDSDAPKTCPIASSENAKNYDPHSIQIDAEPKYHLERISFVNNKALVDQKQLRLQFPIKDSDVYDSDLIAKGLGNLRRIHASLGYIDFAVVPHLSINDTNHTIALEIYFNEAQQFFVSRIDIIGLDEHAFQKIKTQLMLEPGQPYNQELVYFFLEKHSPGVVKAHCKRS